MAEQNYLLPEPKLPTWDDVKQGVSGLAATAKGMLTPPDPYQAAGDMVNAARKGDYMGALNAGMTMPGIPQQGMFVGPNHPSWSNATHQGALVAEKMGATPEQIWGRHMNYKDAGGHWWQEIPDPPEINTHLLTEKGARLGAVRPHPELYQGPYKALGKMNISRTPGDAGGYYQPVFQNFMVPGVEYEGFTPAQLVAHEVQHGVSDIARGPRGASAREFENGAENAHLRRPGESPWFTYRRSTGENLANATARRLGMDMDARRAAFPEEHMTFPAKNQLTQYNPWDEPGKATPKSPGVLGRIGYALGAIK